MTTETMRIECADNTRRNRKAVLGLIEEASSWLRTKDTDQWAKPWPNKRKRNKRVRLGLKNGKTWIVWHGTIPVATVTIAERANEMVWGAAACDMTARAVYVHRLVTRRSYAGSGLGEQLIDWAGQRGRDRSAAQWIRIDVWTGNTALHEYYTKRGFLPCGWCPNPDYPSGALFEKPVASIGEVRIPEFPDPVAEFDLELESPGSDGRDAAKVEAPAMA
jgi:GNAT superfamily N-acetyltransferase